MGAKALKPWRTCAGRWRGGRIVAVAGATMTIECVTEPWQPVQQYACAVALLRAPVGSPAAVGNACAVRFADVGEAVAFADRIVVEVRPAQFIGMREGTYGHVGFELTHESPVLWETD